MHSYLRAIGFSKIKTRSDMEQIIGMVLTNPTEKYVTQISDRELFSEISKDFSERMGITIRGEYDEKGFFHMEHYFPYFNGQEVSVKEEVIINKKVDTESYTAMCDDMRLGVSLIFFLQNVVDYIDKKNINSISNNIFKIILTGLSLEGKILLPTNKDKKQIRNQKADTKQRNNLTAAAKKGDQEAIDSLTIEDIGLYAMISRRARVEDVYTIVDSTFIPFGSEADNYSIIGEILEFKLSRNELSNEMIYDLLVQCNELIFSVCINKMDLEGEPEVGRRFKGNIWMQGMIDFSELG